MERQQRTQLRKFSAPQGLKISDRKLPMGTYPAFLYDIRYKTGKFGEQLNLFYFVHAPNIPNVPNEIFALDELVTEFYSTGCKFGKRMAAVNGVTVLADDTDFNSLDQTGPLLLSIVENEDGYNKVSEVGPLRSGDPRRTALINQLNKVHPDGWETKQSEQGQNPFDFNSVSLDNGQTVDASSGEITNDVPF